MAEPVTHNPMSQPGRPTLILTALLAAAALCISVYLSYISSVTGQSPAGCGSGSGCAEVLASKWSRVSGMSVSLLAVAVYASVLVMLPTTVSRRANVRLLGKFGLTTSVAAIAGSTLWFTYLQVFVLKALCPYCMTGHVLGLLLAVLVFWRLHARYFLAGAIGLMGAVLVAVVQINTSTALITVDSPVPIRDSDTISTNQRTIAVLDGQLVLNLNEEPLMGPPDAERVVVVMFDYACPHCRHTHEVIEQFQAEHPGRLAAVLLPTPLNRDCNPHAPEETASRFEDSCELARIAVAVYLADPTAFPAFDRWLFEPTLPRSATSARDEAIRRLGSKTFEQASADPRMQQKLTRNVHAYGQSGADYVPVLIVPGASAVVGRVDDQWVLIDIMDNASVGVMQ